jgi:hypothetical protein
MPYEKAPSSGAFLPLSLMYFLSGEPMHDLSGVDNSFRQPAPAVQFGSMPFLLAARDHVKGRPAPSLWFALRMPVI